MAAVLCGADHDIMVLQRCHGGCDDPDIQIGRVSAEEDVRMVARGVDQPLGQPAFDLRDQADPIAQPLAKRGLCRPREADLDGRARLQQDVDGPLRQATMQVGGSCRTQGRN